MPQRKDTLASKYFKAFLQELPYFKFRGDLTAYHGPFNNSLSNSRETKKSLDKSSSLCDLELFNANTRQEIKILI